MVAGKAERPSTEALGETDVFVNRAPLGFNCDALMAPSNKAEF